MIFAVFFYCNIITIKENSCFDELSFESGFIKFGVTTFERKL